MLNKNKILIAGIVGGFFVAVPNISKALYQCLPCPTNSFAKPGTVGTVDSCVDLCSMEESFFSKKYEASVGNCVTGSIKKGYPYKVKLVGGKGGKSNGPNYDSRYNKGGYGAVLETNFIAPSSGDFLLCAGRKGKDGVCDNGAGEGGLASSLVIFVAGQDPIMFAAGGGGGVASYKKFSNVVVNPQVADATYGGNGSCVNMNENDVKGRRTCGNWGTAGLPDCGGRGGDKIIFANDEDDTDGKPGGTIAFDGCLNKASFTHNATDGYAYLYSLE